MYSNGHSLAAPAATILLILPEAFRHGFAERLNGHRLHYATTCGAAEAFLTQTPADAIIALHRSDDNSSLYHKLRAGQPYPLRPLLFLVSDTLDEAPDPADATLTLETTAPILGWWLPLRRQALVDYQQRQALEKQIELLKASLAAESRARSEMELLKSAIVRNVSHELRTPLVQVKSAVAMLAEDTKNKQLAEYATEATARLEMLVKNITMLGESLEANPGPTVARETINYVRRSLRRIWERRENSDRIEVEIPDNLPPIYADKQGLNTVFFQLLDNALKFSKEERVIVRAELSDDGVSVRFSVIDHGIGIAPDKLESIFDLFYQVDGSTTRPYGGMGVGLALVRLILDNHNTRIQVQSALGKGTTFSFTLPTFRMT